MRRFAAALTAALLLMTAPAFAQTVTPTEESCPSSWHIGTLVMISTPGEPGGQIQHLYLAPGQGGDADLCLANPALCEQLPCLVDETTCLGTWIGSCIRYRVQQCSCDGKATVVETVRLSGYNEPCE